MSDEELRREIGELRSRLDRAEARLRITTDDPGRSPGEGDREGDGAPPSRPLPSRGTDQDPAPPGNGRRHLLLTAGAAVGAVAAAGLATAAPAGAADGGSLVLGQVNDASSTTQLNNVSVTTTPVLAVQDESSGVPAQAAVVYVRGTYYDTGVYAQVTGGPAGPALRGRTTGGIGVQGEGPGGVAVKADGTRQLELVPQPTAGAPTSGASALGQVYVDQTGGVWCCVVAGTPGTWRRVAGPFTTGSFTAITPTRVYDSRNAGSGGPLSGGQTRVRSVADGIDLTTGAVTVPNLVPAGATAIQYNLTVVGTVGAGYLQVAPGDATQITSSSINWTSSGQVIANGLCVRLDTSRQVKAFAGGGSTDFLIDVLGYYL